MTVGVVFLLGASAVSAAGGEGDATELSAPKLGTLEENPVGPAADTASRSVGAGAVARATRQRGGRFLKGYAEEIQFVADDPERERWWNTAAAANTNIARINMRWSQVAPTRPANGADPADPAYRWGNFDAAVTDSAERGQKTLLTIFHAPDWAEGPNRPSQSDEWPGGTWKPDPTALGEFAEAVATRYSGQFGGLPALDYVVVWNESNLTEYLTPQSVTKKGKGDRYELFAPDHYRKMVNAFNDGVNRSLNPNLKVVAGATSPYGDEVGGRRTRPLQFFRDFLCLKENLKAQKSCPGGKPEFDVLSHHPITLSGGPNRSAIHDDDVAMPDFKHVVTTMRAAEKRNTVDGNKHPVFASEFWWETNPPDPEQGVPVQKHARWVQESVYSLWKQGASAAIWFKLLDDPYSGGGLQAGHFYSDGSPKPSYQAFRFPFHAQRKSQKRVSVWTIAPESGQVVIERQVSGGWQRVGTTSAADGVPKTSTINVKGKQRLRANLNGETTIPVAVDG